MWMKRASSVLKSSELSLSLSPEQVGNTASHGMPAHSCLCACVSCQLLLFDLGEPGRNALDFPCIAMACHVGTSHHLVILLMEDRTKAHAPERVADVNKKCGAKFHYAALHLA